MNPLGMTSTLFVYLALGVTLSYGAIYQISCDGRKMGDVFYPEGSCARCEVNSGYVDLVDGEFIYHYYAQCFSCGSAYGDPKKCYAVQDKTLKYPDCCEKYVCRGEADFDEEVFQQQNPDN